MVTQKTNEVIGTLLNWRKRLLSMDPERKEKVFDDAESHNRWFTRQSIERSLDGILFMLKQKNLLDWLGQYDGDLGSPIQRKSVGLIMAGNIPLVGFHDLLCVLVSGHHAMVKLSTQDRKLLPFIVDLLYDVHPEIGSRINFVEKLSRPDAVIATGSDNSSRYFRYYFRGIPHIIRKNRTSIAVLDGNETSEDFHKLGIDITTYFGLGCRNVSKLYIPEKFQMSQLLDNLNLFQEIIQHSKYANNYGYYRSILLLNHETFLDNGFMIFKESAELVSPVSMVYFERYSSLESLESTLLSSKEKIQAVASRGGWFKGSASFGTLQTPLPSQYPDQRDTLDFLLKLDGRRQV